MTTTTTTECSPDHSDAIPILKRFILYNLAKTQKLVNISRPRMKSIHNCPKYPIFNSCETSPVEFINTRIFMCVTFAHRFTIYKWSIWFSVCLCAAANRRAGEFSKSFVNIYYIFGWSIEAYGSETDGGGDDVSTALKRIYKKKKKKRFVRVERSEWNSTAGSNWMGLNCGEMWPSKRSTALTMFPKYEPWTSIGYASNWSLRLFGWYKPATATTITTKQQRAKEQKKR